MWNNEWAISAGVEEEDPSYDDLPFLNKKELAEFYQTVGPEFGFQNS